MSRRSVRRLVPAVLAALTALVAACAPFATYPPVEGSLNLSQPDFEPIPLLMAEAIIFCDERYGSAGEVVFNLPEGTPPPVYERVIRHLGEGRPMEAGDAQAYHVEEVRVRGLDAQVDVIYPRSDGVHQLVTISFRKKLRHYAVASTRLWRIHVEAPPPHYVAPESEAIAAQPTDDG
ncbi:MAG: hypothetical protein ACYTG1_00500 [Planctomycetota bacterium]|jgi:hypothetical protein